MRYMHIRLASSGDAAALVVCDPFAERSASRRTVVAAAFASGSVLLAEDGSHTLGFIILEHSFFGMGFVPLVAVAPAARRQGVALQLLAAVEARCQTPKLFTSTNVSNAAAQALFGRAGFMPSGRVENLDLNDPELIYFKPLARSAG